MSNADEDVITRKENKKLLAQLNITLEANDTIYKYCDRKDWDIALFDMDHIVILENDIIIASMKEEEIGQIV